MFGLPSDLSTLNLPNDSFGPKADHAFYPHDPANVHHSYLGDFVKFRNLHVGKEQHIFHLHNAEANQELNIYLKDQRIKHDPNPVYLGVTLDRSLTYHEHLKKIAAIRSAHGTICFVN